MRGVIYLGNRRCEVREFPDPVPGPGQVVVKMKAAGICGSDLGWYRGTPEDIERLKVPIASHEPAGVVIQTGSCVSSVRVGDRVAVYHKLGCGHCEFCRSGRMYFCPNCRALSEHINGGAADLLLVSASNCLPLPDWVSFEVGAVLMCAGGTAFSAIKATTPSAADVAVVLGLGPIGLSVCLYLLALGVHVIGVDLNAARRKLALEFGVAQVLDPSSTDVVAEVMEATEGIGADIAYECTGKKAPREQSTKLVRKSGKVCLVGLYEGLDEKYEATVVGEDVIYKELKVMGVNVFAMQDYWEILEFIRRRNVDFEKMITHRFLLSEAEQAFQVADSGNCGKVVFVWG